MNEILTCKYPECGKYFDSPVLLPCGISVCKEHINCFSDYENSIKFKCEFGNHEHESKSVIFNSELDKLLRLNFHLNESQKIGNNLLDEFQCILNKMGSLYKDPYNYIFDYFSVLKNEIDKERERLKLQIDKIAIEMIEQLESFEKECKVNLEKSKDLNRINLNEMLNDHSKWKKEFRSPNKDSSRLEDIIQLMQVKINENKKKISNYERQLLLEKRCNLKIKKYTFHPNLFADFSISDSNFNQNEGLLHFWSFNNTLNDSIGGAHLSDGKNFELTTDKGNKNLPLLSLNKGYLKIPPGVYFTGGDFTLSSWVKIGAHNIWQTLVDFGNGGFNDVKFCLVGNKPDFVIYQESNYNHLSSTVSLEKDKWHHVAFILKDTTAFIYLDGIETASGHMHSPIGVERTHNYIGKCSLTNPTIANIHDLKIFGKSLIQEEILFEINNSS